MRATTLGFQIFCMSTFVVEARMFIYTEYFFIKIFSFHDHWLEYCAHIHATVNDIVPDETSVDKEDAANFSSSRMRALYLSTDISSG